MKNVRVCTIIFVYVCFLLLFSKGNILCSEEHLPAPCSNKQLVQTTLDYLDNKTVEHPALAPLSSYSTKKGKDLAKKYQKELHQVITFLTNRYPFTQMEIRAVGFFKPPQGGEKDSRYLSVIMDVSEEYEIEKIPFEKRAAGIFKKYIDPVAMMLLKFENILKDADVEGVAICPNWMLKKAPKISDKNKLSEGLFVCIDKNTGKKFAQGIIDLPQLPAQAAIYARQGYKIFKLNTLQME